MMQGDQYIVPFAITYENGTDLAIGDVKEIEIFAGNFRKTLSAGTVGYSEDKGLYFKITQKETFMLKGDTEVQARLLFDGGDVIGVNLGKFNVNTAVSKVVLE